MSKDLFLMMREEEVATSNFLPTKNEIKQSAKDFACKLVNSGEHNLEEVYAQALRLKEALAVIEAHLKSELPEENFEAFGLKGTYRSGGESINYKDDEVWAELKQQLTDRETLLKAALKLDETVYDSEGVEIPKVSTTQRKSSLAITF